MTSAATKTEVRADRAASTTSKDRSGRRGDSDHSDYSDHSHHGSPERCDGCKTTVDLTRTVLFKDGRIVGCSRCRWGSAPI
jgi:hypothetical protein